MLEQQIIETARTEWAAPMVLRPKNDGIRRLCVDHRKLNAVTKHDSPPILRMNECIYSVCETAPFFALDANSGQGETEIETSNGDITAFASHYGHYRFICMPVGLRNARGTYQVTMDIIHATVKWQFALAYLENIVIFSETPEEHIHHTQEILTLLKNAEVTLKLRKCQVFTEIIDCLGNVIRPRRIEIASYTKDAITGSQEPTNITEIRSFQGLCNVFGRLVPNFARLAAPLNKMFRTNQSIKF